MNWSYLFRHWFLTLIIGPIISQIMMFFFNENSHQIVGLLEIYPISLIFGLLFSTPTYILYGILYHFLGSNHIKSNYAKVILITFSISGVIITTSIIKGYMMQDIAIAYSIASFITGFLIKLNFKNDNN
jgi:hypothetical protein